MVGDYTARNAAGFKAWSKEQDKEILLAHEYQNVIAMRRALWKHKTARALLADAWQFEYSVFARDPITDILCRVRHDLFTNTGWIVDLKKTQDASPKAVSKTIYNFGYHHQQAFYLDVSQWGGIEPKGFAFIFIEEQPPHAIGVYVVERQDVSRGRKQYRNNLNLYARCLERDEWPGYEEKPQQIGIPYWGRRDIDNEDQELHHD